jgi:molybdopterin-guanine dinucleotide biosynthesis protein B
MKPLIVLFAGYSNSGKTTFIKKLMPILKKRNLKIGFLKHDVHNFEMDKKGKDTYRIFKTGADMVAISSPYKFALIKNSNKEMSLRDIIKLYFNNMDIVMVEGYKKEQGVKFELNKKQKTIRFYKNKKLVFEIKKGKNFKIKLNEVKKAEDFILENLNNFCKMRT